MKGIRFYEDLLDSRKKSSGNVIAVLVCNGIFFSGKIACYEAIGAIFHYSNSPVAGTSVSLDYLRAKCKRISEQKARKIHPNLFKRLDNQ